MSSGEKLAGENWGGASPGLGQAPPLHFSLVIARTRSISLAADRQDWRRHAQPLYEGGGLCFMNEKQRLEGQWHWQQRGEDAANCGLSRTIYRRSLNISGLKYAQVSK